MRRSVAVRFATALAVLVFCAVGCRGTTEDLSGETAALPPSDEAPDSTSTPEVRDPIAPKPDPVPYVPARRPGSAEAYDKAVRSLTADLPADVRDDVPWPDVRNANPIIAQQSIFDLWIWMAANHPDPDLVEIMAAPNSPSRETIVSVFGRLQLAGTIQERSGSPYRAYDHRVVTFESAGLPLWLARDVPDDAVVVYYRDDSGPTVISDQETGQVIEILPAVPPRAWLSIMVPTNVGWLLWRDQLIEPGDPELEYPDVPPPGLNENSRVEV